MTAWRRVPGKPAYEYSTSAGEVRRWSVRGEDAEPVTMLEWVPIVTRYIVVKDSKGKIIEARYTLTIADHEDTIDADDLGSAESWKRWPGAVGVHDKPMREVLAIIVQDQAQRRAQTVAAPYWSGDNLVMPGPDLLERGYGEKFSVAEEVAELLRIAERNPKLALIMGFSYGAPYVEPLDRQPFWVHSSGVSSKGKTTGLLAAASLHGRPGKRGINRPWNASGNGVTLFLGKLAIMPAFLDELHMAGFTPPQLKRTVHTTCDGSDRFTSSRKRKLSESPAWYGVLFSTGNYSVTGVCPHAEIAVRVVEIPTPITLTPEDAKRAKKLAIENYGWWTPVPREAMRLALAHAEDLIGIPEDGGTAGRVVENLALGVAGAYFLGGKELADAALSAARELLAVQVEELREEGVKPSERLLEEIRQAVVSRPNKFPTAGRYSDWVRDHHANHGLAIEGFADGDRVQILTRSMARIATDAGLDNYRIALRELRDGGLLKVGSEKGERLRKKIGLAGQKFDVYEVVLSSESEKTTGNTGNTGNHEGISAGHSGAETVPGLWPVPGPTGNREPEPGNHTAASAEATPQVADAPSPVPGSRFPVPGSRSGKLDVPAPCAAGDGLSSWHRDGIPLHANCDPPAVVPVQEEIPPADPPRSTRAQRAEPRADRGEQLARFARAIEQSGRFPGAAERDVSAALTVFSASLDGLAWGPSAGTTGQWLFEKLEAQYGNVPVLGTPPNQPDLGEGLVTRFDFVDQAADVGAAEWVASWDVNGQFLGPLGGLELGTGEPEHVDGGMFLARYDRKALKLPGYARLTEDLDVWPGCTVPGGQWVPNPVAEYLLMRYGAVEFAERWVWPEHRRWLALWGSRVTAARTALMARDDLPSRMALVALKQMYAKFLGGWLNSGPSKNNYNRTNTLRPDWMHATHAQARMNAFRALGKTDPQPFCVSTDTAYFLLPAGADVTALDVGLQVSGQVGKWKRAELAHAGETGTIKRNNRTRESTIAAEVSKGRASGVVALVHDLHARREERAGVR
ncbi:hypothetical protein Aph01nite_76840 [Acrocarpospora phusangensis]|uniref:DUF927 domain-containing protein n=1 Tax=Acrocarpospora phusangensis TaxID=1070424 RepID=A0A919UQ21_9ACTN|nr:DUF927 domain-containing protein [Acrocarpospora phusangensis]GIH29374.1 hypothetical protein Aph01nite_76840 [Acrocarpospora phusangensis]